MQKSQIHDFRYFAQTPLNIFVKSLRFVIPAERRAVRGDLPAGLPWIPPDAFP